MLGISPNGYRLEETLASSVRDIMVGPPSCLHSRDAQDLLTHHVRRSCISDSEITLLVWFLLSRERNFHSRTVTQGVLLSKDRHRQPAYQHR
jgi:hypothetical protein